MRLTNRQTTTRTLTDLNRAWDRHHPVTITYTKADGTETIRTIEIYDIRTTSKGDVIVKAMDRQSGESRTFRVDRIHAYTIHRTAYVIERPTPTAADLGIRVTVNTPNELICRELAREDRDYWNDRYDVEPAA
ncbi:WYL domain-containing protein [Streptomyces sp. NPDC059590]|uniref:WYL domain-containing protein n=1 Tax=Streptomyces sp. NPDC059590 TaxID=3346877 RepID=UPI0036B92AC0